jgi:hypothetical protein
MTLRLAIALSFVAASGSVAAQSAPVPGLGTRVRVFAPTIRRDRYVGRIDSLSQGEMVLDTTGARRRLGFDLGPVLVESFRLVRLRTSAIENIEVSGGRTTRSATIKGIVFGGLIGGVLIAFGSAPEVNPTFKDYAKGFPVGAAAGAVVGGVLGFVLGGERWIPAELPR